MKTQSRVYPRCIAFCGEIATGKSTLIALVAEGLARKGWVTTILDFDQLRRIFLINYLNDHYNSTVLSDLGVKKELSLQEISRAILDNPSKMRAFGELLGQEILRGITLEIGTQEDSVLLLEWPGLPPKALLYTLVTDIISICCSTREQIRRLADGDLSLQEIRHRMRMQRRVEESSVCHRDYTSFLSVDTTETTPLAWSHTIVSWISNGNSRIPQFDKVAS